MFPEFFHLLFSWEECKVRSFNRILETLAPNLSRSLCSQKLMSQILTFFWFFLPFYLRCLIKTSSITVFFWFFFFLSHRGQWLVTNEINHLGFHQRINSSTDPAGWCNQERWWKCIPTPTGRKQGFGCLYRGWKWKAFSSLAAVYH